MICRDALVDFNEEIINLNDSLLWGSIEKAQKGDSLSLNYCFMCMKNGALTAVQYDLIENRYNNADRE